MEEEKVTPLEYRPQFKRTERERVGFIRQEREEYEVVDSVNDSQIQPGIIQHIIQGKNEVKERLESVMKETEQKLKEESIPSSNSELVQKAKEELGLTNEHFTLLDYKEALLKRDTPAGAYLVDVIEKYIEDINGNIEWELYADYIELQEELALIDMYAERLIYPILGLHKEATEAELVEKETSWLIKKDRAERSYLTQHDRFKDAMLFNQGLIAKERAALHGVEKDKAKLDHETSHLENTLFVLSRKTENVHALLDRIEEVKETELNNATLIQDITQLSENDDELVESLVNMELMLKLAIDKRNYDKHQIKHTLRNTYTPEKQEGLLSELAAHHQVYTQVTLPTVHFLRAYQDNVNEETEAVFNEISLGLQENQANEQQKLYEFYALQRATTKLRESKLNETALKDKSRQAYHLFKKEVNEKKKT